MLLASAEDKSRPVEVRQLKSSDRSRWDAFVKASRHATFFHSSGWQKIIAKTCGHSTYYLYAEAAGRICGVLPLGHVRSRLFGNALISTPFCVYGGIASESEAAYAALHRAARELADRLKVDHLEMRNVQAQNPGWSSKDLYVTFRKTIDSDPETNLLRVPRKQRAMIRKGIKAGLVSEIDEGTERFYSVYSESVRNLGTPVMARSYFRSLKETFGDACEILTVTKEGRPIASVMSFYFKDQVLPYYGGSTQEARRFKGNDFMYWELMRRAGERGVRTFDFGRSKKGTGSHDFKKNWGFIPDPLHYEYYLVNANSVPDISPLNPKYRLFIKAWKRMPIGLSRFIGPTIAKNLG